MKNEDFVTLFRFASAQRAHMYKSILESNGVAAFLMGEEIHDVLPMGGPMSIELQVSAKDEEKARKILESKFDKDEFEEGTKKK